MSELLSVKDICERLSMKEPHVRNLLSVFAVPMRMKGTKPKIGAAASLFDFEDVLIALKAVDETRKQFKTVTATTEGSE